MASEPEPVSAGPSMASPSERSSPMIAPSGRRVEVLATLAIVGALVAAVASRPLLRRLAPRPTRDQCARMLDRYAEEEARAADPVRAEKGHSLDETPPGTIAGPTVDRCVHDLTAAEVTCGLRSFGADELERCIAP